MSTNPVYTNMHNESVPLDTISEGYIKNVAFISLRISLMSFFRTSKALNRYLNDTSIRTDMTDDEKNKALGVIYAHEAYNALFHYQNFMELAIKDIRHHLTGDNHVYEESFANNLTAIISRIDSGTVPPEYHFLKLHEQGARAINKLRNESVHSGVNILKSEALNELFGKYAFPLMIEISKLPLFQGNRYWKYNLDNEKVNPIEDIIDEYTKPTADQHKIQLLKLIGLAAFDNEIYITKKELEEAQHDLFKMHVAAVYGMIYAKKVEKAEKEAEQLSMMNSMDAMTCPVCQNKTLVLEQDSYDDGENHYENYTYEVHCTQCGFKIDHYLINRIAATGVQIEDYSKIHS